MHVDTLLAHWRSLGANARHERHLLRTWACALPLSRGRKRAEHFLPLALRQAWPQIDQQLQALAQVHSSHPAADGAVRLLVGLHDGQTIESVRLPPAGLCVSTQVGCAVGCTFCMTGRGGLTRQLGSAEIVAQVALARRTAPVDKVVFMGMGEPAHNLDAVLQAITVLGTAGGIGHKNLVLSTVGDERLFQRLLALRVGDVRPALALSLHTTRAALRRQLLPRAAAVEPAELAAQAQRYAQATGYPTQIQWTLIEGVNDGDDEVQALAELLQGHHAMVNLIPCNAVDGTPWRRPAGERAAEMARALNRRGILTRLRQSAGQDVQGGCGQLRARQPAPAAGVVGIPIHGAAA